MKRFLFFLCAFCVLSLSVLPCFASELDTTPEPFSVIEVNDYAPQDRTPFISALDDLFGVYTPRTQTVTSYLSDGSSVQSIQIVPGIGGLDWSWIASVALFVMSLYCIFRMIGGLIKWKV